MIQSVEIKNYKNFKHLKMENFKLINFFTGDNDTGKTNILETLYINTGFYDPATNQGSFPLDHAVNISEFRKIKLNEDNLKTFFHQQSTDEPISICTEFEHTTIPLTIKYPKSESYDKKIDLDNDNINTTNPTDRTITKPQLQFFYNSSLPPITMTYEPEKRNLSLRHPNLDKIGQTYKEHAIFIPIELSIINSLKALQSLRLKSKEWELIEVLQCFNPDILNAEDINGSIYIQVKDEKLPLERIKESPKRLLNLFGWGFTKFFTTASILIDNRIKYLFIDEIENGLHHTKMQEFLETLFKLAKKLQIQIFATTHNKEFLLKAINTIPNNESEVFKDIALFNLYKDECNYDFIEYDYSMLNDALLDDDEVRD
ncbi:AAA family ATPase [Helicobacter cetorum]|uniref:AAA family ATPase n=1 Tax=Helicobacter cetorum TaxID=138563 RepID=UPI000CF16073|nr:ATP/GTP-binding protein [Helicobacter cetorum]